MDREKNIKDFLRDFHRAQDNAIYFLEVFWNKRYPHKKIELTDEEKEKIYRANKIMVPFIDNLNDLHRYEKIVEEKRKQGLKDWEIY